MDILRTLCEQINLSADNIHLTKILDSDYCSVQRKGEEYLIFYNNHIQLGRALLEIKKNRDKGDFCVDIKCELKNMGIMLDCSRNGVLNISTIKNIIRLSALMGYNMVLLYMEDVYTIESRPYFGYLRGRYSEDELRELDAYASEFDIQLVPCIQTLAHMNAAKKWWELGDMFDVNDILLCDNEKTYQWIDDMFASMRKCFKTDIINIGMDEADMVGLGRYLKAHGYVDRFTIILKHLNRVCEIAEKYGFKPMMWSDMFFRIVNDGIYYGKNPIPQEVIDKVPENVSLAYWDYRSIDSEQYDRMLEEHNKFNREVWMVNTAWKCIGIVPHNNYTFKTFNALYPTMKKHNIKNFFTTCWGDNGSECSIYSIMPSLCYFASHFYGVYDLLEIKEQFKALTDIDWDTYMLLDTPNELGKTKLRIECPTKYYLYNDLFSGFLDARCCDDFLPSMQKHVKDFEALDVENLPLAFNTAKQLCRVLEIKILLGRQARAAYKNQDVDELKRISNEACPELIRRIEDFHKAMYAQWNDEYKHQGFEIQDIRIGGLIQRIKTCKQRIDEYLKNGTPIMELEQEILPFNWQDADDEHLTYYNWANYVTVNTL